MNRRLWVLLSAIGLVLAVSPATAFAQDALMVNVPFAFMASGKSHPAGEYRLQVSGNENEVMVMPAKGDQTVALVQSRLSVINSPEQADRVVFDKVGNTYYLSEMWLPGEDGFLLYAAKGPHTHHTVKIVHKAK
jgi:hypothetical protein